MSSAMKIAEKLNCYKGIKAKVVCDTGARLKGVKHEN
jgi:hypothetical protein